MGGGRGRRGGGVLALQRQEPYECRRAEEGV